MKSYRFLGEEAEALGNRLDAARKSLAGARSAWARNYWHQTVERLLFQWRQLPILHDAEAQVTIIPRWHVTYEFYEPAEEAGIYDIVDLIVDRVCDTMFSRTPDLTTSWENHRAARLARAQF
jgi:hypothetical protein